MGTDADQIAEWKHAYRVLNVPLYASSFTIKQRYRQMVKRWHPDKCAQASPEYAEATQMTQIINVAFAEIKDAPLRYFIEACPAHVAEKAQAVQKPAVWKAITSSESWPRPDWVEYAIRFVCGAFLGIAWAFSILKYDDFAPRFALLAAGATIVIPGLLAARFGDKFWHAVLRRWWLWW
jgi:hypothetical protein